MKDDEPEIERCDVRLADHNALVHLGGDGPALLLLHGAWGDASVHWSAVWHRLARDYRVIAPELPGFGIDPAPSCGALPDYVAWLDVLLEALGVERATVVGNSLGAALAWSMAGRAHARVAGVVLVNGTPMPATPRLMRWMARSRLGRPLMRRFVDSMMFDPSSLERAFVGRPAEYVALGAAAERNRERLLDTLVPIMTEGDGPPKPTAKPLLLWGAGDRSPRTTAADAQRLCASLEGAELELIEHAGHLPQVEAPTAFVDALRRRIPFEARAA